MLMAQEIKINIDKGQSNNDTVCFNVKNCTKQDIWFYTYGLLARLYLKDANGMNVSPTRKSEADPINIPKYVLIEADSVKKICIPIGNILLNFDLLKDEKYYLFFEYENLRKKPKSKIKTYIGKIEIQSLEIQI